ncbi:hypothetical protein ONE63_008026 [Megalurothrips usitatus]|uniref:Elongation of very long chain fatty acids protein n=1 Tax=Megalurothrips usitatus TaxID=439358 RepID=A0AAV7XPJ5_9NEOP|nr:hypothetical protein ONE63_008026 [Megalurothrips usitatus]
MTAILKEIARGFQSTITDNMDPRSSDWLLVCSPLVPLSIIAGYLLLIWQLGRYMAHREAWKIEPVIIVYNVLQVLACTYIFTMGVHMFIKLRYNLACQPVDKEINEENNTMARMVFAFYIIKIADLLDTVFFALRKKTSHVSFLHVYHHAGMVFVGYLACTFSLNGHFTLIGVINSFVHMVMYTYYLMTLLDPDRKPGITIKKSLTLLQLAQFCIVLVHSTLPLFQPTCQVQKFWCALLIVQSIFMILLFSDFYIKAYSTPLKEKTS